MQVQTATRHDHSAVRPGALDRLFPDRLLGWLAIALLAATLSALARGGAMVTRLPWPIVAHLALLIIVLALTPLILWRPKGSRWHRRLGWSWALAMGGAALVSFGIRASNAGGLSVIHLLSAYVLIAAPLLVLAARRHQLARHRGSARRMTLFALLVAGFFTFPFDRLLGSWLFA